MRAGYKPAAVHFALTDRFQVLRPYRPVGRRFDQQRSLLPGEILH